MLTKLTKDKKYLLACSYGPDSMALFSMLIKHKIDFAVAHVNYQMRGAASQVAFTNLKKYAEENNVKFYGLTVDGHKYTGNFQAKAREERYNFFLKLVKTHNFSALLTAHNEDDHIETYLMQTQSKKTTYFYGINENIMYKTMKVMRPLLNYSKQTLLDYCLHNNIPFELDQSNESRMYTRNKLRLEVVNKLTNAARKQIILEISHKNALMAADVAAANAIIDEGKVEIAKFIALPRTIQNIVLYILFVQKEAQAAYTTGKVNNIIDSLRKKNNSAMFKVNKDIYFVKAYTYFLLININDYRPYEININSPNVAKNVHFTANLDTKAALEKFPIKHYPLKITSPKTEDIYAFANYKKKVSRMLVDMKMPRHLRLIWPIVRNNKDEIIFVPRYRANYKPREDDIFLIKT